MKIIAVKSHPGFRLELHFDNGESGLVDLSEFVGARRVCRVGGAGRIRAGRDHERWGRRMAGELDMCPDALYLRMTGKKPEDLFPSLRNRLSHA